MPGDPQLPTRGFSFALSRQAVVNAAVFLVAGVIILGGLNTFVGPHTAQAGYITILFLLTPSRTFSMKWRLAAAAWVIGVSISGFLIGSVGIWATLIGLVIVCLVQSIFKLGEVAALSRSPVNFVVFAGLGEIGDVQLWQVALGAVVGAAVTILVGRLAPAKTNPIQQPTTPRQRLRYGLMIATGAVIIVILGQSLDPQYTSWTLLAFCMILAVGFDSRVQRARDRLLGAIAGAIGASIVMFLPSPIPLIITAVCALLAIAYINMGSYGMFIAFLTPSILLLATPDLPTYVLAERFVTITIFAAGLALICSEIFEPQGRGTVQPSLEASESA